MALFVLDAPEDWDQETEEVADAVSEIEGVADAVLVVEAPLLGLHERDTDSLEVLENEMEEDSEALGVAVAVHEAELVVESDTVGEAVCEPDGEFDSMAL